MSVFVRDTRYNIQEVLGNNKAYVTNEKMNLQEEAEECIFEINKKSIDNKANQNEENYEASEKEGIRKPENGFFKGAECAIKGSGKAVGEMAKSCISNEEGKFSPIKAVITAATVAGSILVPPLGVALCAVGGAFGIVQAGKGIYDAINTAKGNEINDSKGNEK